MKIAHVLAPAHAGGLERVVHALAIGQQRLGHHVVAVAVVEAWTDEHPFAAPLARANIEIRPIVVPARAYRREWSELGRVLRELAPDVVHTHGYHTDVIAGALARRAGIAAVSTSHGFTRGPWRNRVYESIDRFALRNFDAVAAVSRPLADELTRSGVPADRIDVVPNAWSQVSTPLDRAEARRAMGIDPDRLTIGWVGRMTHEKGLDIFVDALGQVGDLAMGVCIMGDGPERAAQTTRASALSIGDRVHWAGLVREAGRYFLGLDALVLSSRTEGVPMVILEAMSAGVPLVAPAVGGIPDVLTEREALLVPPERPDALAAAIRSVVEDRAAATARARAASERLARDFAEGPWLGNYDRLYDKARARVSASRRGRSPAR